MKRLFIFSKALLLFLSFLVYYGCETIPDVIQPESTVKIDDMPLRVTMVYPNDCVGFAAYCDEFHAGVRNAESELDIHLVEVNGNESEPEITEMTLRTAAQNSDLIITAGYQLGAILERVAPDFPDKKFAIFDVVLDIPNVVSVNYKSNEGSFLVGAIAAIKSENDKIGFIGGVDIPLIHEFEAGYVAGIRYINPNAAIHIKYISKDVSGFTNPDKAKEIATNLYLDGVDVIYAAAGGSGQGVLEAAQEQQQFIIWVDSNGNHLAPGIVLTSMVKIIKTSVQTIIQETLDNNFLPGIRYFGLEDDIINYTLDEYNQHLISDEIISKIESIKLKIISGEIIVPNTIEVPRK